MYKRKWKPSKKQKQEFANTMNNISSFCKENGISQSRNGDSYYFTIAGVNYRVSNHSVEASNNAAYDEVTGEQIRELYHENGRNKDTFYIHASKTRIIEIYNNLKEGKSVDHRGCVIA